MLTKEENFIHTTNSLRSKSERFNPNDSIKLPRREKNQYAN